MARVQESSGPPSRSPDCNCDYCTGQPGPMFKHLTPLEVVDVHRTGSRKYGATQKQFQEFVRAADAGLRVEMLGQNYVAMSRNMYEELKRAANPINVTIEELTLRGEEPTLSDDAWAEMNRILDADREVKS